jgi:hypothetical protein
VYVYFYSEAAAYLTRPAASKLSVSERDISLPRGTL